MPSKESTPQQEETRPYIFTSADVFVYSLNVHVHFSAPSL